jgi:hypothetical protein
MGSVPHGITATLTAGSTATSGITTPPTARIIGVLGDSTRDTGKSIILTLAAATLPTINTPMQLTASDLADKAVLIAFAKRSSLLSPLPPTGGEG